MKLPPTSFLGKPLLVFAYARLSSPSTSPESVQRQIEFSRRLASGRRPDNLQKGN